MTLRIKAQILCDDEIAMGPGKADLLDAIAREGSISAAGRAMGMSYRRAWLLVDVMNRCWAEPLVQAGAGGPNGGGARLTTMGERVLATYRALERTMRAGAGPEGEALAALVRAEPKPMQR